MVVSKADADLQAAALRYHQGPDKPGGSLISWPWMRAAPSRDLAPPLTKQRRNRHSSLTGQAMNATRIYFSRAGASLT